MATGSKDPAITFSQENGIRFGDLDCVQFNLSLFATDSTTNTVETAAVFEINIQAIMNVTLTNFVIYPDVKTVVAENAKIVVDNVGLYDRDYNYFFTSVLKQQASDINVKYKTGWPISNLDPQLAMITGLIKNSTVSPYVADEWIYAGFSMQADLPTAPYHELEFI